MSHWVRLVTNRRAGICFLRLTEVPPCLTEVPQPQQRLERQQRLELRQRLELQQKLNLQASKPYSSGSPLMTRG